MIYDQQERATRALVQEEEYPRPLSPRQGWLQYLQQGLEWEPYYQLWEKMRNVREKVSG